MPHQVLHVPTRRLVSIGLLSWLSMLGVDFLLHGGVLAGLYAQPGPFLLQPSDAFGQVPLGYASFLLLSALLLWLKLRLGLSGWRQGFPFGLRSGALIWGALVLGLFSVSTAGLALLAG